MPDWKFSERGRQVKLGCKMGRYSLHEKGWKPLN